MTIYEQIQKSLNYIEENLFTKLTSDKVAYSAHMSSRSFYHYFWIITGYSYKEYVIKRRLMEAVKLLLSSHKNILSIALDIGYESHEAFARAFKKEFGISPFRFRKSKEHLKGVEKIKLYKEMYMGVIVKKLPQMKAASFQGFAPDPEKKAIEKMQNWLKKKQLENKPHRVFGHNIDLDGNIAHDPENVGYKVLVTIEDDIISEDDDMHIELIEPGEFVVTGIEDNFTSDPEGKWITKGWQKLHEMIKHKGYKIKCPVRWFEEELEPSVPGNLRLDLYLEIE